MSSRRPLPPGAPIRSKAAHKYTTTAPADDYFEGLQNLNNLPATINFGPSVDGALTERGQIVPIAPVSNYPMLPMTFTLLPPNVFSVAAGAVLASTEPFMTKSMIAQRRVQLAKNGNYGSGTHLAKLQADAVRGDNTTLPQGRKYDNAGRALKEQFNEITKTEAAMQRLDPLTLLVNPESFSKAFVKKFLNELTTNGQRTEHWGEELDVISASGQTGGFYTAQHGITRFFRRNSAAFQNLMQLYMIYRNNGRIYSASRRGHIHKISKVALSYDGDLYIGAFQSFNLKEDANTPFRMSYDFEFSVELFFPGTLETNLPIRVYSVEPPTPPAPEPPVGETNMTDEELARRHAMMAMPASFEQDDAEALAQVTSDILNFLRG